MYPRSKKVFIQATQDQVAIRRWYEESQENGAEIAYYTSFVGRQICPLRWLHVELKRHIMVNFQVTEEFLVLTTIGRNLIRGIVEKMILSYVGPKKNGVNVNEVNLARLIVMQELVLPLSNGAMARSSL